MEKINLVEILKDCPHGMELYCTSYDNVSFDKISDDKKATYPIFCYITDEKGNRSSISFTENGCESKRYGAKCVIFPKDKKTWEGFIPFCKFKDGDILADKHGNIAIYKGKMRYNKKLADYYCGYRKSDDKFLIKGYGDGHFGIIEELHYASKEEKQKLFDVIEKNDYEWDVENKILVKLIIPKFKVGDKVRGKYTNNIYTISRITSTGYELTNGQSFTFNAEDCHGLVPNKFDVTTLKPYDRVLARCSSLEKWRIQLFEKFDKTCKFPFICMGYNKYKQCIPYEGNEHLLDTADSCSDYYLI